MINSRFSDPQQQLYVCTKLKVSTQRPYADEDLRVET